MCELHIVVETNNSIIGLNLPGMGFFAIVMPVITENFKSSSLQRWWANKIEFSKK